MCVQICIFSARNSRQLSAIFEPISTYGQPKSILVSQIYCTFWAINNLQKVPSSKNANQFLILFYHYIFNCSIKWKQTSKHNFLIQHTIFLHCMCQLCWRGKTHILLYIVSRAYNKHYLHLIVYIHMN